MLILNFKKNGFCFKHNAFLYIAIDIIFTILEIQVEQSSIFPIQLEQIQAAILSDCRLIDQPSSHSDDLPWVRSALYTASSAIWRKRHHGGQCGWGRCGPRLLIGCLSTGIYWKYKFYFFTCIIIKLTVNDTFSNTYYSMSILPYFNTDCQMFYFNDACQMYC